MTTAYAAKTQYGPGAQATSGGNTYRNGSPNVIENTAPPAAPWEQVGVDVGLLIAHVANAATDGALTASADAALTAVTVAAADAATQSGSYVQADAQTIATLANANKVQLNALIADVGALRTVANALVTDITALRTAFNAAVSTINTLMADMQSAGIQS